MLLDKNRAKKYFATKAISNSLLGALDNPRWIKIKMDNPDQEDEDKKHFRVGSALDCILTGNGEFEEEFYVIDVVRPTGYMGKFVENLPDDLTPVSPKELYQEAYDKAGYKAKLDTIIKNFWENYTAIEYYHSIRNSKNKKILSKDEYDSIICSKDKILSNKYCLKYFVNKYKHIELIHQLPIFFNYMGEQCKALMDGVRIDHSNKTIEPFDLKTTGRGVYEFQFSFMTYGYYRQAAFYSLALKIYIEKERPELLEYKWLPFIFIVVDSKLSSSYPAIIYETTAKDIEVGMDGGARFNKEYKGINDLIRSYKYHSSSGQWDLPEDIYNANGRILLNVFDNANENRELPPTDIGDRLADLV